jgi:hypothetical protein
LALSAPSDKIWEPPSEYVRFSECGTIDQSPVSGFRVEFS